MTWEEALDEIANKYNHENWYDFYFSSQYHNVDNPIKEAAELFRDTYAKSKWEEAAKSQKDKDIDTVCKYMLLYDLSKLETCVDLKDELTNNPSPEFKP